MTTVKILNVTIKGKCCARPPLVWDERKINPMLLCTFKKGHTGPHQWETPEALADMRREQGA